MKEVKTLWEVEYSVWGAGKTRKRYFESKEDAEEWAKEDYRDNPVKKTYPKEEAERILEAQAGGDAYSEMYH